jgi:hypothetical protein
VIAAGVGLGDAEGERDGDGDGDGNADETVKSKKYTGWLAVNVSGATAPPNVPLNESVLPFTVDGPSIVFQPLCGFEES